MKTAAWNERFTANLSELRTFWVVCNLTSASSAILTVGFYSLKLLAASLLFFSTSFFQFVLCFQVEVRFLRYLS